MSVALEDLWDAPAEPSSPRRLTQDPIVLEDDDDEPDIAPRPSKRPRSSEALFLAGDSDDDEPPSRRPPPSSRPDIDAMFADLDNDEDESLQFQPLGDSIDKEKTRREAAKRAAADIPEASQYEVMPSSSPARDGEGNVVRSGKGGKEQDEGEEKERKKIARMDEARLVGPTGFPALIKSTKEFVPKGKGHEAGDLNRLLQVYQYWTHRMYPKTQFKDTVDRVEKLCHSKRMHVSLSVWRDEAKGLINGMKPEDLDDDAEADAEELPEASSQPRPVHSKSSSPVTDLDVEMEMDGISRPPSSTTELDAEDDFDIDALIREEEAKTQKLKAANASASPGPSGQGTQAPKAAARPTNDDDDMWDILDNLDDQPAPPSGPSSGRQAMPEPSSRPPDEDDEMWDIADEMGMGGGPYDPPPPPPAQEQIHRPVTEAGSGDGTVKGDTSQGSNSVAGEFARSEESRKKPTNDEDWDDMYL